MAAVFACSATKRRVFQTLRHSTRTRACAGQILPAEAYTSEAFWEFEKHAIFSREWLCIGHVNEVPSVGDYLPLTVLGEPLLLVHDEAKIRVLSSVCRHRGHPIAGDRLYGGPPHPRLLLHAWKLAFALPWRGGERVEVEAPPPPELASGTGDESENVS